MSSRYQAQIDLDQPNNTHASLVRMVGENKRVLELGAASGYMTTLLKSRGCSVTAIEYDPDAVDQLMEIADRAIIGDLNDPAVLDAVSGPFDVVLAGDVLEHLLDPLAVLRRAVSTLTPDGEVVISIPNVGHIDLRLGLMQGRFDYRETGLLDATHIRFFTYDTFLDLIAQAGLLPVEIHRIIALPFETELAVPRESVSADLLHELLRVPESETYQFVLRAIRDNGDPARRDAAQHSLADGNAAEQARVHNPRPDQAQADSLSTKMDTVRGYLVIAERDRDEARTRAAETAEELTATAAALAHTAAEVAGLQAELVVARRELIAACIGESRRTAMQAEIDGLTGELMDTREAAGFRMDSRPVAAIVTDLQARAAAGDLAVARLDEITGSRAYRLISSYRAAIEKAAPRGSRRRSALGRVI